MRWIQTARVSLQRVGALLAITAVASDTRRSTVEALGKSAAKLLMTDVAIPMERTADVAEYVRRMHLWQRYEKLRELRPSELAGHRIQAQDLWLSDPAVPSASGAVTDRVTDEPAQLAVSLRLIRAQNHTLTDRGRSLRLAAGAQTAALRGEPGLANPMCLSQGSGLIVLDALLEADYDFLRATHRVAIGGQVRFTRGDVSSRMGDVCRELYGDHRGTVRSGDDRQRLARLKELADSIDSAGQAKTWGGARPPDQTSTLRLEPYVDLGLLRRTSRYDYNYELSASQQEFFADLQAQADVDTWAGEQLVERYLAVRSPDLRPVPVLDHWHVIHSSWLHLRSSMGYASIHEVLLLANASLIDEHTGYFNLADGRAALRHLHKTDPKAIRFTMARGGAVKYFKLSDIGARA